MHVSGPPGQQLKLWESVASEEQKVGHLAWEREDCQAVKVQETQGYLEEGM